MEYTIDQEYIEGLNNLRNMVRDIEVENDKVKREFYMCEESQESLYEDYLKSLNDCLLRANTCLKKESIPLQVVDSEVALVGLINNVRETEESISPDDFEILTEFWDQMRNTLDSVKLLVSKLENRIFTRMTNTCQAPQNMALDLDFTSSYVEEVSTYSRKISQMWTDIRLLLRGFTNGIPQDLFTNSSFIDRILLACDVKAFPILRIVPDVTEKLSSGCRFMLQWMDRDETYVYDVNKHLRDTRAVKRKKVRVLINKRQQRKNLVENVHQAQDIFVSNREKLKEIEAELKTVETQVAQCTQIKEHKAEEKRQKEGIVGFLEISISQTSKNVTLQLKRSRVMRQLRTLENHLREVEEELSSLQDDMSVKEKRRTAVAELVENNNTNFTSLQTDLEQFTETVEKLQTELIALTEKMGDLEYIQNLKTSPELIDDFFERPIAVKLAPSLKMKIQKRHKAKTKHR